jgi:hypothetical protein
MKKILASLLLLTSSSVYADNSDWVAPLLGGVIIGNALSRPMYVQPPMYIQPPMYYNPPPIYVQPPVYYERPRVYYEEHHRHGHHHEYRD